MRPVEVGWDAVVAAIDTGDLELVAGRLLRLDERARREVATALPGYLAVARKRAEARRQAREIRRQQVTEAAWREHVRAAARAGRTVSAHERWQRDTPWNPPWTLAADESWAAPMLVAGAAAIGGVAAVVAWLNRRDLQDHWDAYGGDTTSAVLERVLSARPPAWQAELAVRAALKLRPVSRRSAVTTSPVSGLVLAILRRSGATPPEHDPLVVAWAAHSPSVASLRTDPLLDHLLPRLFEAEGVGAALRHDRPDLTTTSIAGSAGLAGSSGAAKSAESSGHAGSFGSFEDGGSGDDGLAGRVESSGRAESAGSSKSAGRAESAGHAEYSDSAGLSVAVDSTRPLGSVDRSLSGSVSRAGLAAADPAGATAASPAVPVGSVLRARGFARTGDAGCGWLTALTALAREGRIGRDVLLDGCLRRFLRGGHAADLRFFVRLHDLLAPTRDEVRERHRDYLRLLPAAPGAVAETALKQVRRLGEADPAEVTEALRALLARGERKLLTAGLTWLDEFAAAHPDADLDPLAAALGKAFGCESGDVQGRAVRVAVKHARRFTGAGAQALREAVAVLPQGVGETLAELFGERTGLDARDGGGFVPVSLPEPPRVPDLPPPVMSAADLDVRPVVTRWEVAEAWLAGVVRLYEQDRVGLEARLSQVPHAADPPPGPWTEVEQWVEEIARSIANGSTELMARPAVGAASAPENGWPGIEGSGDGEQVSSALTGDGRVRGALGGGGQVSDAPGLGGPGSDGRVSGALGLGGLESGGPGSGGQVSGGWGSGVPIAGAAGVSAGGVFAVGDGGPGKGSAGVGVGGSAQGMRKGRRGWGHLRLPEVGEVAPPHLFLLRRLAEVYDGIVAGTLPPYLLAEPTEGTGHVDAGRLVERVAGYERGGVEPMPADLAQALLRVPRTVAPDVVVRAGRLTSAAGQALALRLRGEQPEPRAEITWVRLLVEGSGSGAWVADGDDRGMGLSVEGEASGAGVADGDDRGMRVSGGGSGSGAGVAYRDDRGMRLPVEGAGSGAAVAYRDDREPVQGGVHALVPRLLGAEPTGVAMVDELMTGAVVRGRRGAGGCMHGWPYLMPSHREVVAGHLVPYLLERWRPDRVEPRLAQALVSGGGVAGEAVALVQAYFVADPSWSGDPRERARAVVGMAARGDLDGEQVGRQLALLVRRAGLRTGPVFETLEGAAGLGAHREVWGIMTGFLTAYLPGPGERSHTRHTQALTFALRAARWAGARGAVGCVAEIARRRASNNFVREARRLHTYLT
ncbi:hypothetical protein [Nonomuraea fuscirosea]|uniref:hypothetical protein n=1 Tax=Nonomuraea fuscirosea TaxID=1291556 RepID=UPI003F4DF647